MDPHPAAHTVCPVRRSDEMSGGPGPAVRPTLLVIYTESLEECRQLYANLGIRFVRERHGTGPEHYAAALPGGVVIELYPARGGRATGALRLGFAVEGAAVSPPVAPGCYVHRDPDGRAIDVHAS